MELGCILHTVHTDYDEANIRMYDLSKEGYLFYVLFRVVFFSLLAFWLLGFLASWLLGFLASWLFGFSASWLFVFLLVYAAFGGFLALAFRMLFTSLAFPVPLQAFWLLHPFWLPASSASPVFSLFESSLLRTS